MDSGRYTKLRTMIVMVSMIALPAAAVFGLKSSHFRSAKAEPEQASRAAPAKAASAPAERTTPAAGAKIAGSGTSDVRHADHHEMPGTGVDQYGNNFAVRQAANIDVGGAGNVGGLASLSGAAELDKPSMSAPETATQPPARNPQQFSEIQSRLRALGATYYALETWGTTGELYRFQCRMAAGHDPGYTRQFEATDTDPLSAMATVLDEVEAWKAGRLP